MRKEASGRGGKRRGGECERRGLKGRGRREMEGERGDEQRRKGEYS